MTLVITNRAHGGQVHLHRITFESEGIAPDNHLVIGMLANVSKLMFLYYTITVDAPLTLAT